MLTRGEGTWSIEGDKLVLQLKCFSAAELVDSEGRTEMISSQKNDKRFVFDLLEFDGKSTGEYGPHSWIKIS
jgi:hypothetical protein